MFFSIAYHPVPVLTLLACLPAYLLACCLRVHVGVVNVMCIQRRAHTQMRTHALYGVCWLCMSVGCMQQYRIGATPSLCTCTCFSTLSLAVFRCLSFSFSTIYCLFSSAYQLRNRSQFSTIVNCCCCESNTLIPIHQDTYQSLLRSLSLSVLHLDSVCVRIGMLSVYYK